jgi:hypothetical protein
MATKHFFMEHWSKSVEALCTCHIVHHTRFVNIVCNSKDNVCIIVLLLPQFPIYNLQSVSPYHIQVSDYRIAAESASPDGKAGDAVGLDSEMKNTEGLTVQA